MAPECNRPGAGGTAHGAGDDLLTGLISPEYGPELLNRQASRLQRRYGLTTATAIVLAEIHYDWRRAA